MKAPPRVTRGSRVAPRVHSDGRIDQREAHPLLAALWRSPNRNHYVAARDRAGARFLNVPVGSVRDAIGLAFEWVNAGFDVYVACAEYATPCGRRADDVSGAFAFWLDIDCGEQNAVAPKGYRDVDEAVSALTRFCIDVELPHPTHVVASGSGLHVYWVLDASVGREEWQESARKLKRLNEACGFQSDGSRTADIASLLRVPGSLNFKYTPPRPVRLQQASENYIPAAAMRSAIDRAHFKLCGTTAPTASGPFGWATRRTSSEKADRDVRRCIDHARLRSALVVLDPDCNDEIWKLRRIAPLAEAARASPEHADALCDLAQAWSSGALRGTPSHKWRCPGTNGLTGEQVFDSTWERFLTSNYSGARATLGTIYYDATQAGWVDCSDGDRFEMVDGDGSA